MNISSAGKIGFNSYDNHNPSIYGRIVRYNNDSCKNNNANMCRLKRVELRLNESSRNKNELICKNYTKK